MSTKRRGSKTKLVRTLLLAVFALLCLAAASTASGTPIGFVAAFGSDDSSLSADATDGAEVKHPKSLASQSVARRHLRAGLSESRRASARRAQGRASAGGGTASATPATLVAVVDKTAPQTTLIGKPATITVSSSAYFSFSSSEAGSTFTCKMDAGAWTACPSPKAYTGLINGYHQFYVRAKDKAGNVDSTPAAYNWKVQMSGPSSPPPPPPNPPADTTAPQTSITGGPEASTTATAASFVLASSESGSRFECKLDSGAWAACASPKAYSGLIVGAHEFSARATDAAGNRDATAAVVKWTVAAPEPPDDTTAPNTTIASGPASSTTSNAASFSFVSTEAGSGFACKLDSGSWRDCNSPKAYSGLAAGSHRFSVRAADPSGNVDTSPATYDWTIQSTAPPADTTPPNTSITSKPPTATTADSAQFSFSASESGSTFECKLDDGPWEACTPPQAYDSVPEGEHKFLVRATDKADNVDGTPATAAWTVEEEAAPPPAAGCTTTVSSTSAAQSALASAASGAVVCLASGSYGKLTLDASKSGAVTVRAATAGKATIAGASLSGANITLARFVSTSSISVQPGASGMTIEHNRVTGGGQGIDAGPTSTTTINDTKIIGNELIGPFGEDAIHLNRYHDGNGDGIGVLIEGNEITNVRENGNHSDCLQTVWVGDHIVFRKNYLHDNRCQGFFVKDQASLGGVSGPIAGITVENNLFLRNKEPCAPEASGCGQPIYLQVFGPYSGFVMKRNTIWGDGFDSMAAFRESTGSDTQIANNVIYRLWTDTNMSATKVTNNTVCKVEAGSGGSWPSSRSGETTSCTLSFRNAASDDYRISGSDRGVDWAPAEQLYGP